MKPLDPAIAEVRHLAIACQESHHRETPTDLYSVHACKVGGQLPLPLLRLTSRQSPARPKLLYSSNRKGSPPWLTKSSGSSLPPKASRWLVCSARKEGKPGSAVSVRAMHRSCGLSAAKPAGRLQCRVSFFGLLGRGSDGTSYPCMLRRPIPSPRTLSSFLPCYQRMAARHCTIPDSWLAARTSPASLAGQSAGSSQTSSPSSRVH